MATTASRLMKGPKPTKDGINAKIDYVHSLAGKGITREEAIHKLLKKFPGTKKSYARSIVYSRCAGLDFVRVRRAPNTLPVEKPKARPLARKEPGSTKAPVKKKAPKKVSARPIASSPEDDDPVVFGE